MRGWYHTALIRMEGDSSHAMEVLGSWIQLFGVDFSIRVSFLPESRAMVNVVARDPDCNNMRIIREIEEKTKCHDCR